MIRVQKNYLVWNLVLYFFKFLPSYNKYFLSTFAENKLIRIDIFIMSIYCSKRVEIF